MATQIRDLARISELPELDGLLRQLPLGVVIASAPDGGIIYWNQHILDLFPHGLAGFDSVDAYASATGFRPNGRQYAPDEWPMARALHGEVVEDEELELRLADGRRRIVVVSAAPVLGADEQVVRALATVMDVTEQRQEERRREFLMELSDDLRMLTEPDALLEKAAVCTGEHLGVSSVAYADVDASGEHAVVQMEYRNGRVVTEGRYFLEDFGARFMERIRSGGAVAVEDLAEEPDVAQEVFAGWNIRSLIAVPIVRQERLIALFTVLHSVPRTWTASDVALVENVAERTWHAVENARAQAELRRSREWLSLALRAGSTALWEWDLRTGRIRWSEEQDSLFGRATTARALTFGRWLALVHPDDRARARASARNIATMRDGDFEFEYRVAGAAERWITMRGRIVGSGGVQPHRVVGVAVDTTDRKSAELERERLLEETREASEAKSHFIGVISHEFRTPLTAIIGYTELLATGVSGTLTPSQSRQLDRIRTSAWHLTQMVDEILTFSRLEAGRESLIFDTVDVVSLARETAALVAPGAGAKGLGLACELPDDAIVARADSGKLRQVLLNLLSNAVKFTEKGGLTLSVRPAGEFVEFAVTDTGIGIAAEHLDRIWERFWQAGTDGIGVRTVSGAGLGLTVCRRLVELMGGEMNVSSDVGVGSTFRFTIPIASA